MIYITAELKCRQHFNEGLDGGGGSGIHYSLISPLFVSNSTIRFFADDTLLYLAIHNSSDCTKLQEDINNLQRWESDWQMYFHQEFCEVIHITTKKKAVIHKYALHGHTLSSVPQIKYLGVHISQDLKWNSHINLIHPVRPIPTRPKAC